MFTFFDNGKFVQGELSKPQIVNTPVGKFKIAGIRFEKNDQFYAFWLSEPQFVDTPAGKLKLNNWISFYKNGKLKSCSLYEPQIFDTTAGKLKLTEISFHKNGALKWGLLAEQYIIKGKKFDYDTVIGWDSKGNFLGEMEWSDELEDYVPKK